MEFWRENGRIPANFLLMIVNDFVFVTWSVRYTTTADGQVDRKREIWQKDGDRIGNVRKGKHFFDFLLYIFRKLQI
jgi:hypothetical protein